MQMTQLNLFYALLTITLQFPQLNFNIIISKNVNKLWFILSEEECISQTFNGILLFIFVVFVVLYIIALTLYYNTNIWV